ncbi:MAG: DUF1957 domain-containing protein [Spirochaetota bacterium]|jgi:1,4-alpha-glucan branching enzyme|nr:DUF1957 domain-containing protein [Spirochaetota bacterium]
MAKNIRRYLTLLLHAHLPFVRHPEYDDFLEENWLYETITETYIPLLDVFEGLERDGIDFRITMSITPPLANMLADPMLQNRYLAHIHGLMELSAKEIERTRWMPEFHKTAQVYSQRFSRCRYLFEDVYNKNLLTGFRRFQEMGKLEIITCGATHAFLPLMDLYPNAVRAQIQIAKQDYERHFGCPPNGIWNGECGYYPGLEKHLEEAGIKYFFVDAHGILYADALPRYGVFAPLYCPNRIAAFGRDLESSRTVWSAESGYPGDPDYREFYRDIGFDLEFDYIKPYIHESGLRTNTGIKYYRITGKTMYKEPYNREKALAKAEIHAGDFLQNREKQMEQLSDLMGGRAPIVVSPYDAELFGHWWYEGPEFLDSLIRRIAQNTGTLELITPSEYLERCPDQQVAQPSFSSWGNKGYSEVWLNESNDWIYRHLHKACERMNELANTHRNAGGLEMRALNQAARELLLAQSSDWAFIMKSNTMVEYAVKRTKRHINHFTDLYYAIKGKNIDEDFLNTLERRNTIFPGIDYRVYCD